jgi:hypothetical protein
MAGLHKMVLLRGGLPALQLPLPAILAFEFSTSDLPPGLQIIVKSLPKDSRLIPILVNLQSLASLPSILTLHQDHAVFALLHRSSLSISAPNPPC